MPNDTTTQLNPGAGGDKMDESLVTQTDGVTLAKRPRVVPGSDSGTLQSFDSNGTGGTAHVIDDNTGAVLKAILVEMRRQTNLLRCLLSDSTARPTLDDDELDNMTPAIYGL